MTRMRCLILLAALALLWAGVPAQRADTVQLGPDGNDTRILSGGANTNYHNQDILTAYNNGGNNVQHSLVQFDLSSIPDNQTIAFATLTIYRDSTIWGGGDNGMPTNVFRVTTPWVPAEATWVQAANGTPWTNAGGDYVGTTGTQATDPYASNLLNIPGSGGPNNSGIFPLFFDVTQLVTEWSTGVNPNNGLLIEGPPNNELHFRADRGNIPYLYPGLTILTKPQ